VAEDRRRLAEKLLQGVLLERVIAAVHRGHVDQESSKKVRVAMTSESFSSLLFALCQWWWPALHNVVSMNRISPHPSRITPSGTLIFFPQGMFFSTPITTASASIQPRFPTPTANITSINDQQHPTQNSP